MHFVIARAFPFPVFSILDNGHLPPRPLCQGRCLLKFSRFFSAPSRTLLSSLFLHCLALHTQSGPAEWCSEIQYLRSSRAWTIPSLIWLALHLPPVGIIWLLLPVMLIILTSRYHTFPHIPADTCPLPVALCPMRDSCHG